MLFYFLLKCKLNYNLLNVSLHIHIVTPDNISEKQFMIIFPPLEMTVNLTFSMTLILSYNEKKDI